MHSHLDIFVEVPVRSSGGGVHLVRWGLCPDLGRKVKKLEV